MRCAGSRPTGRSPAFAGQARTESRSEPVGLAVVGGGVVEARVPLAARAAALGIDLLEEGDHFLHRSMQAVQVQTVEARLPSASLSTMLVMGVQPVDEVSHDDVPPHPGGEALEPAERFLGGSGTGSPASPGSGSRTRRPAGRARHARPYRGPHPGADPHLSRRPAQYCASCDGEVVADGRHGIPGPAGRRCI